jgi:DUF4097 and DUF4098 domain-containing protein YvlB
MHARTSTGRIVCLLAVAVAAVGLAACDVVISSLDVKGRAEDQWTRSYPIAANGEVEIVNTNGGIEVTGGAGTQVEVTAERTTKGMTDEDARKLLGQLQAVEEVSASRVHLEMKAPAGESGHLEVKYHVKAPSGVSVRLRTTNGGIEIATVNGAVNVDVTNGTVRGRDLGGAVEATTVNGTVRLDMLEIPQGGIRAETVNGSVDLSMPASAKADVDARCLNGRISVDGMKLETQDSTRRHLAGRLNGGGPKVALDTTNGSVRITGK